MNYQCIGGSHDGEIKPLSEWDDWKRGEQLAFVYCGGRLDKIKVVENVKFSNDKKVCELIRGDNE